MFNKIICCLRLLTLISVGVISVGCITPNPDVILSSNKVKINVGKISVSDLSIPNEKDESGVWASGYIKLSDKSTNPPFSKFVFDSLSSRLIPAAENQKDILEVMLLSANIQMQMKISDSIAFVGLASALSSRDYLCTVVINLRLGAVNKRNNFESKMTYSRSWSDLDTVVKKELVESCVSSIVNDTANFANSFVTSKQ